MSEFGEAPSFVPEIFSEAQEISLRSGIRKQIDSPFDIKEYPRISETERQLTAFSDNSQEHARLFDLNEDKVKRWFEIVFDEIEKAKSEGAPFPDVPSTEMARHFEHEMAHLKAAEAAGVDMKKASIGVHFGKDYSLPGHEGLGFQFGIRLEGVDKLHIVDQTKIALAPQELSFKDQLDFLVQFKKNTLKFGEKPFESIYLLRKFQKSANLSFAELVAILKMK